MENKILVTGGYGLVGSEFIKPNFIPLSSIDVDLRIREDVDNIFKTIKFDSVIHCAGNICHPSTVPTDIQVASNQLTIMSNVLDACAKNKVKKSKG